MVNDALEMYGQMALSELDSTQVAGRYASQVDAERRILWDVSKKLQIQPSDHLLEIGSGPGQIAIPLSFIVDHCVVVDHKNIVERLNRRYNSSQISAICGDFLEIEIEQTFDKILVYSVLHCLPSQERVKEFIMKAAALLRPGGVLLLGDIPNVDKKARFLATDFGQRFDAKFRSSSRPQDAPYTSFGPKAGSSSQGALATFDDEALLEIVRGLRSLGLEAYVHPQPADLPFGHTREDIIAFRHRE